MAGHNCVRVTPMSVPFSQIPSTLLLDPDMTLAAVRVWHIIYTETLGRPGWDLSYQQIADNIGADKRTAQRAVDLLLSKGWLRRIRQKNRTGDAPNLFIICREPGVPWNQNGVHPVSPGGGTDVTRGGALDVIHQKIHLPGETAVPPSASPAPFDDPTLTKFAIRGHALASQRETAARKQSVRPHPPEWTADDMPLALFRETREKHPGITPDTVKYEWARFINYNEAKGLKYARWNAAWWNWILKADRDTEQRSPNRATRAPSIDFDRGRG